MIPFAKGEKPFAVAVHAEGVIDIASFFGKLVSEEDKVLIHPAISGPAGGRIIPDAVRAKRSEFWFVFCFLRQKLSPDLKSSRVVYISMYSLYLFIGDASRCGGFI